MASIEAWGGPSGNSFPLIQTVSAGATPESLARCANAASVRPAAIIPAKARRENISCSYRPIFWREIIDGDQSREGSIMDPRRTIHHPKVRLLLDARIAHGELHYEHDFRAHCVCDGGIRASRPESCGTPFREGNRENCGRDAQARKAGGSGRTRRRRAPGGLRRSQGVGGGAG